MMDAIKQPKGKSYLRTYVRGKQKNKHIDLTDSPSTPSAPLGHVTRSKTSLERAGGSILAKKPKTLRNAVVTRSKNKPSINPEVDMKTLLSYPPSVSGHRTVVSLVATDIETLSPNQLLNDQLMDFWLQYIYREKLSESDRKRSHVFSSYFYNSLRLGGSKKNSGHRESIHRNWMKNVNIFEKDFLFVPISLRSHWFCAVLCFPYLNVNNFDAPTVEVPIKKIKLDTSDINSNGVSADFELPKKPCILVFDSMAKYLRESSAVYRILWKFLTAEIARQTNNQNAINFTAATMPACLPHVPQQTNKTDCGLFVLKFFEAFFTNPIKNFEFPIAPMKEWFSVKEIKGMRQEIYKKILDITERHFPENLSSIPNLVYDDENCISLDEDDVKADSNNDEDGENGQNGDHDEADDSKSS